LVDFDEAYCDKLGVIGANDFRHGFELGRSG